MTKRGKLDIIKDILERIKNSGNSIKPTPLQRQSNLSTKSFSGYIDELLSKSFVMRVSNHDGSRHLSLTEKGFKFLEKYDVIIGFVDEFEL